MTIPTDRQATTNDLRAFYDAGRFSFGNPSAEVTVCIVGSCRIVPILNYLRAYNFLHGGPLGLLCYNPVEMWGGPGTDVAECVNARLADHRIGPVDFLICESHKFCGVLNTLPDRPENIFQDLQCTPGKILRLPNWRGMLFMDSEVTHFDEDYRALDHGRKIAVLRERESACREMFLRRCELSSFPGLTRGPRSTGAPRDSAGPSTT